MTSKAKTKGNSAERELCSHLRKTFDGSFIRVPNSGAYIGGKNAHRKEHLSEGQIVVTKGDIIPPDHMPRLVVESKFYADFTFHLLMNGATCSQLETWIAQTIDCVEPDDFWFVAFKINRRGWFVCVPKNRIDDFQLGSHCVYKGKDDIYVVCDLLSFITDNKDKILELTKKKE